MGFKTLYIKEKDPYIRITRQSVITLPAKIAKGNKGKIQFLKNDENDLIALKFTEEEENSFPIHQNNYQYSITNREIIRKLNLEDGKHTIKKDKELYIFKREADKEQ